MDAYEGVVDVDAAAAMKVLLEAHETHLNLLAVLDTRAARCRATLIALLGVCGRWRQLYEGKMRDPSGLIARWLWHRTRHRNVWEMISDY